MDTPSLGRESGLGPYLRFGRDVLIVDLIAAAGVILLSWKQGWTTVEDSLTAIFGVGAVILTLAVLPFMGPAAGMFLGGRGIHLADDYSHFQQTQRINHWQPVNPRVTWILLVAGAIPIAYAGVVSWLVV